MDKYEALELEIIRFDEATDIITGSCDGLSEWQEG